MIWKGCLLALEASNCILFVTFHCWNQTFRKFIQICIWFQKFYLTWQRFECTANNSQVIVSNNLNESKLFNFKLHLIIFKRPHFKWNNVMSIIWDTLCHIDDDKESLSSMHVVYSFRQQLSTYIPISFLCSKSYFAVTGITSIFLFPASGGFIFYVMFAAAFVHILCFVSFVSYFCFVKYKHFIL